MVDNLLIDCVPEILSCPQDIILISSILLCHGLVDVADEGTSALERKSMGRCLGESLIPSFPLIADIRKLDLLSFVIEGAFAEKVKIMYCSIFLQYYLT